MTEQEAADLVGKRVEKKSGKPFKSRLKINTVKAVVEHPLKPGGGLAFTFVEDDSVVTASLCKGV